MPIVAIPLTQLRSMIGRELPNEDLVRHCQQIGCDVDDLATLQRIECLACESVAEYVGHEHKPKQCAVCAAPFSVEQATHRFLDPLEVMRIDLLSNRADNFDAGGITRTLRGYLGIETGIIEYGALLDAGVRLEIDASVLGPDCPRPHIACAVVRGLQFDDQSLRSLMKLQENLHWALGRDRKHASIGVYDLSRMGSQIRYTSLSRDNVRFSPLGHKTPMSFADLMDKTSQGKEYGHLLDAYRRIPILIDNNGQVLAMPPIVNSEETKVSRKTTDIFIDVTGTVPTTVEKALNIIVCNLKASQPKVTIQSVEIETPRHSTRHSPQLTSETWELDPSYARSLLGGDLSEAELIRSLEKMRYGATAHRNGNLLVQIPPYRHDIMHACDLVEDIAIGYGYNNLTPAMVESYTLGEELPEQAQRDRLRRLLIGLGMNEITTIMLTSEERAYTTLGRSTPGKLVRIANPISQEQTIVRADLFAGVLETLALNTHHELPQRIFEIGDIVRHNPTLETGSEEGLALCVALIDSKMGYSDIKAVLAAISRELDATASYTPLSDEPLFIPGRAASATIALSDGRALLAQLGEVHPQVLENCGLGNPVALLHLWLG